MKSFVGDESSEASTAYEPGEFAFGGGFHSEYNWFVVTRRLTDDVSCDCVIQCGEDSGMRNAGEETRKVIVVHNDVGGFFP